MVVLFVLTPQSSSGLGWNMALDHAGACSQNVNMMGGEDTSECTSNTLIVLNSYKRALHRVISHNKLIPFSIISN